MGYEQERIYIGDMSQLFMVKEYRWLGGRSEGTRAVDIRNHAGVELTLLPDRCMDPAYLTYKGENLSFITPAGIVHPSYYDNRNEEFLRSFTAGLLTTCGLTEMGNGGECDGEILGLHGRAGHLPAEQVACQVKKNAQGDPYAEISGQMRQARLFTEHLTLHREVTIGYEQKGFSFTDTVENISYHTRPFMLLYHFNMGYPLVSEESRIYLPVSETKPRNAHAAEGLGCWNQMQSPTADYEEMCYYHTMKRDEKGRSAAVIFNHKIGLGLAIHFDAQLLDHFIQWKMMGQGDYVIGLEPGNAYVEGRAKAKADGDLKYIQPGEKYVYRFDIQILDSEEELKIQLEENEKMK